MKTKFSLYRLYKEGNKNYPYPYAVYNHSFGCTLTEALLQWKCFIQIFNGSNRFYDSIGVSEYFIEKQGTKFNILSFPIWYLYAFVTTGKIYKVKLHE